MAVLASPGSASACACCANRGDYVLVTEGVKPFELDELVRLRFAPVAMLRTTPAYPADVKGITPRSTRYRVTQFRHARIFVLTLRAGGGKGTVSFVLPLRATKLQVDIQDGRTARGGGPLLYREWTFRGTLTGTAVSGTPRFRLVLQGRGNACMNAADFRSWILVASGEKANFTLYGKFARPAR
jgi:hypothetical protein